MILPHFDVVNGSRHPSRSECSAVTRVEAGAAGAPLNRTLRAFSLGLTS
jgi:hypothetical protein